MATLDALGRTSGAAGSGYSAQDQFRWVEETGKRPGRTAFARDRARVLHSSALRRLAAKTQVMVAGESDFPRTRLTHTLEVAQIGRELGTVFGCDPDLVDVAGLSHDLGHPPYGHNGEDALNEVAAGIGGFEGNAQTLRVLTRLETKVFGPSNGPRPDESVGLNLTRAALDAASKYPWTRREGSRKFGVYADDQDVFDWLRVGAPEGRRCFEAQVMDWADDVAYSVHDLEDAVHSGHVDLAAMRAAAGVGDPEGLLDVAAGYAPSVELSQLQEALQRLLALPFWPTAYDGSLRSLAAMKNLTSQLIGRFCEAAEQSTRAASGLGPLTRYDADLVVPADQLHEVAVLKAVANRWVMQRAGAEASYAQQTATIQELVAALRLNSPDSLDPTFSDSFQQANDDGARLRVIVDQVASLTDRSVVAWHRRLCR